MISPVETIEELDQAVCEYVKFRDPDLEIVSYGLNNLDVDDEFNLPIRTITC